MLLVKDGICNPPSTYCVFCILHCLRSPQLFRRIHSEKALMGQPCANGAEFSICWAEVDGDLSKLLTPWLLDEDYLIRIYIVGKEQASRLTECLESYHVDPLAWDTAGSGHAESDERRQRGSSRIIEHLLTSIPPLLWRMPHFSSPVNCHLCFPVELDEHGSSSSPW